jgi:hypothetical protein
MFQWPEDDSLRVKTCGHMKFIIICIYSCNQVSHTYKTADKVGMVLRTNFHLYLFQHDEGWWKSSFHYLKNTFEKYSPLFQVQYTLRTSGNSSSTTGNLTVKKGTTKSCVYDAGVYEFVPVGCHDYPHPSVKWNSMSAALSSVRLTAIAHKMGGRVISSENVNDMFIYVLSSEDRKRKGRWVLKFLSTSIFT